MPRAHPRYEPGQPLGIHEHVRHAQEQRACKAARSESGLAVLDNMEF